MAVDDAVTRFDQWLTACALTPARQPTRQTKLRISQIITLLGYCHHSGYKIFHYYQRLVQPQMRTYFLGQRQLSAIHRTAAPAGSHPARAD